MDQSGASGFPDLQGYLGNVTLNLSPTGGDFFIRGFGTLSTNSGFEPSVGTVIDGVFYGRSNFLSVFYSDDERMEVLRGPQGTLFGKNSTEIGRASCRERVCKYVEITVVAGKVKKKK